MEKTQAIEAVSAARGFDIMMLNAGKALMGEIDGSNLGKNFVFEGSSDDHVDLHDGTCKVDYQNTDYRSYVFMVHRTRGMYRDYIRNLSCRCSVFPFLGMMESSLLTEFLKFHTGLLLLQGVGRPGMSTPYNVPGGSVAEDEFLKAGKHRVDGFY
jgi:hypothetical protein